MKNSRCISAPKSALKSDWIGLSSVLRPRQTQYRLYGRRFLQVRRPNQQYQSTEGTNSTQTNQTHNKQTWTQNTASSLVYNNMGTRGRLPQRAGLPGLNGGGAGRRGTPRQASVKLQQFNSLILIIGKVCFAEIKQYLKLLHKTGWLKTRWQ